MAIIAAGVSSCRKTLSPNQTRHQNDAIQTAEVARAVQLICHDSTEQALVYLERIEKKYPQNEMIPMLRGVVYGNGTKWILQRNVSDNLFMSIT